MRHVLKLSVLSIAAFLLVGCGNYANILKGPAVPPQSSGPNPNNLPNPNTVPKPGAGQGSMVNHSPIVFSEVLLNPTGVDAGNQFAELVNTSGLDSDVGGWTVSDGTSSFTFPFGFRIAAGSRVLICLGASGSASNAIQFAPSFNVLPLNQGSLALLRGGSEVVDYLQWGGTPNTFEAAAANNQVWPSGEYVVAAPEGQSLNFLGGTAGASNWHAGSATPGN
jgi:hypothetical protein